MVTSTRADLHKTPLKLLCLRREATQPVIACDDDAVSAPHNVGQSVRQCLSSALNMRISPAGKKNTT